MVDGGLSEGSQLQLPPHRPLGDTPNRFRDAFDNPTMSANPSRLHPSLAQARGGEAQVPVQPIGRGRGANPVAEGGGQSASRHPASRARRPSASASVVREARHSYKGRSASI